MADNVHKVGRVQVSDAQPKKKILPKEFIEHFDNGTRLISQGKEAEGEAEYEKAAILCPEAWLGIACECLKEGKRREAIKRFEQTLLGATEPETRAAALNNIGSVLCNTFLRGEAEKYYRESYSLWKHPDSAANLAIVLRYQNRMEEAMKWIQTAIRINPRMGEFYFTRSLIHLTAGRYLHGFADYEARWQNRTEPLKPWPVHRPVWDGRVMKNKTLLLYGEQGAGDTIMMLRYGPEVRKRVGKVILAPQRHVGCIAERMGCWDEIQEDILQRIGRAEVPAYDFQLPLMSLPRVFKTRLQDVRGDSYIPGSGLQSNLDSDKFKVGIVWAGSPQHKHDRWRSTNLDQWADLFRVEHCQFYSLQMGDRILDLRLSDYPVIDLSDGLKDYQHTAAAIEALDLMIAVDTSVVHLAGALGKRCWMLTPFSPDWRWLIGRDDSPWYSSVRLFRQPKENDWETVFKQIKQELENEIQQTGRDTIRADAGQPA